MQPLLHLVLTVERLFKAWTSYVVPLRLEETPVLSPWGRLRSRPILFWDPSGMMALTKGTTVDVTEAVRASGPTARHACANCKVHPPSKHRKAQTVMTLTTGVT